MKRTLFLCVLCLVLASGIAAAGGKAIFELTDPRGDDGGDGTLIYPTQGMIHPGDLDLVSLSARSEGDGTMFEAVFDRAISRPDSRVIDAGGTPLDSVARLGFYKFNIDIYIDTDRKPGSGFTNTLPGRGATIQPEFAWEKVVCLTPRPGESRTALQKILQKTLEEKLRKEKGRVDPQDQSGISAATAMDISRYFFPDRVRVTGRKVSFFVPGTYLNGTASADWAYVVLVTPATTEDRVDISSLYGGDRPPALLMNLPVAEGSWSDRFGTSRKGEEAKFLPPIADLIVPSGTTQEKVLSNFNVNSGQRVSLPGVVPGRKN
jgi:hypothetical protein